MQLMKEVYISSALPHNFQVLPPIPPRPNYPVEWLSDEDTRQYLYPLFTRHWSVTKYKPSEQKEFKFWLMLSKIFMFRTTEDAQTFAAEVKSIADKLVVSSHLALSLASFIVSMGMDVLQHHPTVFRVNNNSVILRVLTDDAFVKPLPDSEPVTLPGITIQDIRLAYRIERIWEKYWEKGKAGLRRRESRFPGHIIHSVRMWGLIWAKLWSRATRMAVLKRMGRLPEPVAADGKKRKRKTPRWKKFKWKNRARKVQKIQLHAARATAVAVGEAATKAGNGRSQTTA